MNNRKLENEGKHVLLKKKKKVLQESFSVSIHHTHSAFPGDAFPPSPRPLLLLPCFSCLVYTFLVCYLSFHHSFLLIDPELGSVLCGLAHFHSNLSIHERLFSPSLKLENHTERQKEKSWHSSSGIPPLNLDVSLALC